MPLNKPKAYYNEIDPFAAQWLRNLITASLIADGDVDERSIEDVNPADLRGYTQCHFFAGIGVWSHALRSAGWPDDLPVWTGSCPCQPFSAAGKGNGTADERHLWPAWFHLIRVCKPVAIFGEQVEAAIRHAWLDLVQADLEGIGYSVGAAGLPAAGFGAPHIRQRLWWVAHNTSDGRREEREVAGRIAARDREEGWAAGLEPSSVSGKLANSNPAGLGEQRRSELLDREWSVQRHDADRCGTDGRLANPSGKRRQQVAGSSLSNEETDGGARWNRSEQDSDHIFAGNGKNRDDRLGNSIREGLEGHAGNVDRRHESGRYDTQPGGSVAEACSTNGFWRSVDWLPCRDGKLRPVESGTFPLAHGSPARVGRLRAYGNAIVAPVAQNFIEAYLATRDNSNANGVGNG